MLKNSPPARRNTLAARTLPAAGAGTVAVAGAAAGHPVVGAVVAGVIVVGQLTVELIRALTQRQVAKAAAEIACASEGDAVKRIGALTDLIDKLR